MEITRMAFAANMLINQVLQVKKGETVVIVTDTDRPPIITQALAYSALSAGGEVVVVKMEPQEIGGAEPPAPVAAAMAAAQVVINQSTYSLTHTAAVREAMKKGARVANLRNVTEEMMVSGGITADYQQVKRITEKLARLLTEADVIRMTTPEGTDFTMRSAGRKAIAQSGFVTKPGELSGLPDGEATLAPLEGVTEGVIVSPYIADQIGQITEPFRMEITKGRITSITGGKQAKDLKQHPGEQGRRRVQRRLPVRPRDESRLPGDPQHPGGFEEAGDRPHRHRRQPLPRGEERRHVPYRLCLPERVDLPGRQMHCEGR